MRRDSIFYQIFQQMPQCLFDLLPEVPENAADYRFDSVAVKEPKFEIDGVFLPPETEAPGVVYFCEVQFQKDEQLYERLFGELFLYFYRNRSRYRNWQAVVIYPTRTIEQSQTDPYRALLISDQVHRIYLDEVGEIRELPIGVALMVLTTLEQESAVVEARYLLSRRQEVSEEAASRAIMEMVTAIMVYQFAQLSRKEIEVMLNLRLEDTRVYREAKEEGRLEGREEGRRLEAVQFAFRLLQRRLGEELPQELRSAINQLSLPVLESLGEALLDFTSLADLENWLKDDRG